MSHRLVVITLMLVTIACGSTAWSYSARKVFQVTFGTRSKPGVRNGVTDSVSFIAEAPNGDVFVAGNGASVYTDTGNFTKPMVARIGTNGAVIWKRVYDRLPNHEILALSSRGAELFIVFKQVQTGPSWRIKNTETVTPNMTAWHERLPANGGLVHDVHSKRQVKSLFQIRLLP